MDTKFSVKEFADFAGVTVRTLQYYDRMGLLKPSGYKNGNHRIYQVGDLLRLQQVLTFKYLGYSLAEIRKLMRSPAYDVRDALKTQRKAIAGRISQLEQVAHSIDRTVAALDLVETESLDWEVVRRMISGIIRSERWQWMHDYYTPQQQKLLQRRARKVTPQQLVHWEKEWSAVLLDFQKLLERRKSPDLPEAQRLAGRMDVLVKRFTRGHKGIEQSLGKAYADFDKVPKEQRPYSIELQRYMSEACAIYRKGKI